MDMLSRSCRVSAFEHTSAAERGVLRDSSAETVGLVIYLHIDVITPTTTVKTKEASQPASQKWSKERQERRADLAPSD